MFADKRYAAMIGVAFNMILGNSGARGALWANSLGRVRQGLA
jgi:hypothetical protein